MHEVHGIVFHNGFHNGFHNFSTRQCASWDSWRHAIPPKYRIEFSRKIVPLDSARASKISQLFAYAEEKVPPQTLLIQASRQKTPHARTDSDLGNLSRPQSITQITPLSPTHAAREAQQHAV